MTDPVAHEAGDRLRHEHEELRELLGSVHRTLTKRLETVAGVSQMFASLCNQIETHFNKEETAGFFDEIVAQAPRLSSQTEHLCNEHECLLQTARKLADQANDGDGSDDWWQQLESEFHEFSKQLMQHENKETDLLLQVYHDDIGSAD